MQNSLLIGLKDSVALVEGSQTWFSVRTLVLDTEGCWGGGAQLSLSNREEGMFGNSVEQEIHTSLGRR